MAEDVSTIVNVDSKRSNVRGKDEWTGGIDSSVVNGRDIYCR